MTPILGIIASSFRSGAGPDGAYDALATVTVPSGGLSTITFAGIPTGYKHLQLRHIAKDTSTSTGASGIVIRFNGDSSGSYAYHYLNGTGSSATTTAGTGATFCNINYANVLSGSNTSTFAAGITDILDYANTSKNKVTRTLAGVDLNGSGGLAVSSNLWLKTEAIFSVTILPFSTSFAENSQFALYGVK
jgi:hypothetical protein